jgi:tetratricopeptide (TPR) repeat protein
MSEFYTLNSPIRRRMLNRNIIIRRGLMKIRYSLGLFFMVALIGGCASLQIGSDFQAGRNALITGKSEVALSYFQSVAEKDPGYRYGTAYRQGVLSYLGRAEYAVGQLPQAQQTLERALAANRDEDLARLYLGLVLTRSGDRQRGVSEIENGMKGINGFLEYVTEAHRFSFGRFWDPARAIRSAIQSDLAMISRREFDVERLVASAETIGKQMEDEVDRARQDETRELSRQNDGGGQGGQP